MSNNTRRSILVIAALGTFLPTIANGQSAAPTQAGFVNAVVALVDSAPYGANAAILWQKGTNVPPTILIRKNSLSLPILSASLQLLVATARVIPAALARTRVVKIPDKPRGKFREVDSRMLFSMLQTAAPKTVAPVGHVSGALDIRVALATPRGKSVPPRARRPL